MGACLSQGSGGLLTENSNGNEKDFHTRFIEDRVLGEGEFGVVRLVYDMRADESENAMACKTLRKGVVFKDNTLYSPLKPEILRGEVEMLRTLAGEHFCMNLVAVYETSRVILLVTEYCAGGEMMEYISKQEEDLRTDDVSRIAFQLLDAINHCAQHDIIHRDLKPANIMFKSPVPGSDLRIIDFGSGTNRVVEGLHTTFAGTPFYNSPEMFNKTYAQKTDVWSIGVTLYVVVAGYPANVLQKAFNLLQRSKRDLRTLPNFPESIPDSFCDMLNELLVYQHKQRKTAKMMLDHEFVNFHKSVFSMEQIAQEAQTNTSVMRRNTSELIVGSMYRHSLFVDYQKYERSLTTLLAALLDKKDLQNFISALDEKIAFKDIQADNLTGNRLNIVLISDVKEFLKDQQHDDSKHYKVLETLDKLSESVNYDDYAYDVTLLKYFVQDGDGRSNTRKSTRGSSIRRSGSVGGSLGGSFRRKRRNNSLRSTGSLRGGRDRSIALPIDQSTGNMTNASEVSGVFF